MMFCFVLQVCVAYTTRRRTQRWPICLLYHMIDISCFNAFILFTTINPRWTEKKKIYKRILFDWDGTGSHWAWMSKEGKGGIQVGLKSGCGISSCTLCQAQTMRLLSVAAEGVQLLWQMWQGYLPQTHQARLFWLFKKKAWLFLFSSLYRRCWLL